jgi:hypothetical protein
MKVCKEKAALRLQGGKCTGTDDPILQYYLCLKLSLLVL